jgi:dTDP-4-amino-4,6-dideoxygalactose transaminase
MSDFLPLTRPTLDEATIAAVGDVLRSGWITSGPKVLAFEQALSTYFGGRPVRVFNSGTATLEVALRLAGVGAGDEVITTPLSWVATANVILTVGATPVFVDVDPVTRNLDMRLAAEAITPRTKAIMPVHLAGQAVDMNALYALAQQHNLRVIEDAAQAMGSQCDWQGQVARIGAVGDLVSFSFHANKNITTTEGGCLVLNTPEEARLAEKYRLQGVTRFGMDGMEVDVLGGKFNMTDVAAVIGLHQLQRLNEFTVARRDLAHCYFEHLQPLIADGAQLPVNDPHSNWHMFQVVLPATVSRAEVMARMKAANIGCGVHYPAIHLFKLYQDRGYAAGLCSHAEQIGWQILTLPLFPAMTPDDVMRVCEALQIVMRTAR